MPKMTLPREFYIPKNAVKSDIAMPEGVVAEVYTYEVAGGIYALAFYGKQSKPMWHYRFGSVEQRDTRIAETVKGLAASAKFKAERKAAKSKPHSMKVGDVMVGSWGYEQTNVDFFEVVELIGKTMVRIEKIGAATVEGSDNYSHGMAEHVVANPGYRSGEFYRVKVDANNYAKSPVHGSIHKYDGKPVYHSWYA